MIKLANVLLLAVAAHCYYTDDTSKKYVKDKIAGGTEVTVQDVPYIAQIIQFSRQGCGGTIISEEWILTAAHCVEGFFKLSVRTGSSFRGVGHKYAVEKLIIHKNFNSTIYDNDIALIKIVGKIKISNTQKPIGITNEVMKANDNITISGFGYEGEHVRYSGLLKSAQVPVIDQAECQSKYTEDDEPITDNMFCAGRGPTDSCRGDSGGPAILNGKLVGIVSSGKECGSTEYPGVYTKVINYRQWIAEKTGLKLTDL